MAFFCGISAGFKCHAIFDGHPGITVSIDFAQFKSSAVFILS